MHNFRSDLRRRIRHLTRKITRPSKLTLDGVLLHFPKNISTTLRDALYREDYEVNELYALRALLNPGDMVLEIGSSIGFLTISACQQVGSDNVIAIEANPFIVKYARKNFKQNGVSPTLHLGIADADESEDRKTFYVRDDFWSSSIFSRKGHDTEKRIECETVPANTIIADHKTSVLICDIEGGEVTLIPKLHLNSLKTMIIEFHPAINSQKEIRSTVLHILEAGFSIDIRASTGDTLVFTRV